MQKGIRSLGPAFVEYELRRNVTSETLNSFGAVMMDRSKTFGTRPQYCWTLLLPDDSFDVDEASRRVLEVGTRNEGKDSAEPFRDGQWLGL